MKFAFSQKLHKRKHLEQYCQLQDFFTSFAWISHQEQVWRNNIAVQVVENPFSLND